jgi:hypothetical protein
MQCTWRPPSPQAPSFVTNVRHFPKSITKFEITYPSELLEAPP